jgi:mRNA degradation ribonuclease J1/J2
MTKSRNRSTRRLSDTALIVLGRAADSENQMLIEAVDPDYVIYSAGHAHRHPRQSTAERYHLGHGVPLDRMFRTDRGDHEGGARVGLRRDPYNLMQPGRRRATSTRYRCRPDARAH